MAAQDDSRDPEPASTCAELLSLAVHELRTPLSVVTGYVRMLKQDASTPRSDRDIKMLRDTEAVCERMASLLAEMSDLARLEAGAALMKDEEFDLFAVLREAGASVTEAADRGVRLEVRGASSGALLRGDRSRISSALVSLLRSVLREQIAACIVVADCRVDDGAFLLVIGEKSLLNRAADLPHVRFDEKRGGLGVLLPIARRIIEHHGGSVWMTGARGAAIVRFPSPR